MIGLLEEVQKSGCSCRVVFCGDATKICIPPLRILANFAIVYHIHSSDGDQSTKARNSDQALVDPDYSITRSVALLVQYTVLTNTVNHPAKHGAVSGGRQDYYYLSTLRIWPGRNIAHESSKRPSRLVETTHATPQRRTKNIMMLKSNISRIFRFKRKKTSIFYKYTTFLHLDATMYSKLANNNDNINNNNFCIQRRKVVVHEHTVGYTPKHKQKTL